MAKSLSIDFETAVSNIAAIRAVTPAGIVTGGREWYALARAQCRAISDSTHGRTTIAQVADVVSVLSPQKSWLQNVAEAAAFVRDYHVGMLPTNPAAGRRDHRAPFCTLSQRDKLESILSTGKGLSGPKVESFRANILYVDSDSVTVDSWAMRVARNDPANNGNVSSDAVYRVVEAAYVAVSRMHNERPYQTQAIVWCLYRALHGIQNGLIVDVLSDPATAAARANRVALTDAINALAPIVGAVTAPTIRRTNTLARASE